MVKKTKINLELLKALIIRLIEKTKKYLKNNRSIFNQNFFELAHIRKRCINVFGLQNLVNNYFKNKNLKYKYLKIQGQLLKFLKDLMFKFLKIKEQQLKNLRIQPNILEQVDYAVLEERKNVLEDQKNTIISQKLSKLQKKILQS